MLRGWLVPVRAVAEGHFGTKAEAESHADMAVAIAQHDMFDLLRAFNENVVDPLLGMIAKGKPEKGGGPWGMGAKEGEGSEDARV
jgi:hypothetical protein